MASRDARTTETRRSSVEITGRDRELDLLAQLLCDGPAVLAVHGLGGIGKTTLLEAFAARARSGGAVVVSLDGREIEPTERGFLHCLGTRTGGESATLAKAAERLGSLGRRVILTLDSCELLRLLDNWLRRVFVPALPPNVRLVLAGRDPPVAAWFAGMGWSGRFQAIALGPLADEASLKLLARGGVPPDAARRIQRFAHGHPLGLRLASSLLTAWHAESEDRERLASERVVEELTALYLADIRDPLTRAAIEASSVARRMTLSLLQAMLPGQAPQDAFARLQALPFVRLAPDGLYLHDLVRETIAAALRARDPSAHRTYRRAAWQQLRSEMASADLSSLWRYTADLLYLIENPVTREAFFPSGEQRFTVEHAEDGAAIRAIAARHEGAEGRAICEQWWQALPGSFSAARGTDGSTCGYYCMAEASSIDPVALTDPVAGSWRGHLARNPMRAGEQALFLRRWLSRDDGEAPCAVQAACWLDIKRTYMEMRPRLRRVYLVLRDLPTYAPVAHRLGFQGVPECTVSLDGVPHHTAVLDFGPRSVDGWLARLASAELGVENHGLLDLDSQELVLSDGRVALTRLEFATLRHLSERPGKNVSRRELLDAVWGYNYQGDSNLVDVVIRSLRKKLGERAGVLETARGVGYRYREE
jgi:Transcriptional regulatory protein, C terminal